MVKTKKLIKIFQALMVIKHAFLLKKKWFYCRCDYNFNQPHHLDLKRYK